MRQAEVDGPSAREHEASAVSSARDIAAREHVRRQHTDDLVPDLAHHDEVGRAVALMTSTPSNVTRSEPSITFLLWV